MLRIFSYNKLRFLHRIYENGKEGTSLDEPSGMSGVLNKNFWGEQITYFHLTRRGSYRTGCLHQLLFAAETCLPSRSLAPIVGYRCRLMRGIYEVRRRDELRCHDTSKFCHTDRFRKLKVDGRVGDTRTDTHTAR